MGRSRQHHPALDVSSRGKEHTQDDLERVGCHTSQGRDDMSFHAVGQMRPWFPLSGPSRFSLGPPQGKQSGIVEEQLVEMAGARSSSRPDTGA